VLEVRDLAVSYGKIQALRGVSLAVRPGEIVALIGPNGAGKSTLLRTIAGILRPDAGTVTFDGRPMTRLAPHRVARLGLTLVPEGRGLLGRMTVRENLLMGQYVAKDRVAAEATLARLLARFPVLDRRQHQTASTLSGGEQQLLVIARAVAGNPRMIMIDEPSLGLAPLLVREIFRVLAELKRDGLTVLLVEQNARQALRIADRAYLLETGRIASEGPAADLMAGDAVVQAYLGA
jgi:branched-chain amino acid transport system ATP-binding protein